MDLKNNSKEMATIVETFVMEETVDLTYDQEKLDKWNDLVKELNLTGQTQIISSKKSPVPFMYMNEALIATAETLCPRKENVKNYNATPIPLDIMELIAMSAREDYFSTTEIWYDEKSKDPFAIGIIESYKIREKSSYKVLEQHGNFKFKEQAEKYLSNLEDTSLTVEKTWGETKHYLIGKWADVKQSFDQLTKKAKKRYVDEQSNYYKKQIKEAQRSLDDIALTAETKFGV
jgi:hypothetical protein